MKKPLVAVCAAVLATTLSMGVFAASGVSATKVATGTSTTTEATDDKTPPQKIELTDEQKAAMETERKAQQAAWTALTDDQKQEIYKLYSDKADAETALVDKYLDLGLIDSDKATKMKEEITSRLEKETTSDKMPMGLMGGDRGPREKPDGTAKPDSTATTDDASTESSDE